MLKTPSSSASLDVFKAVFGHRHKLVKNLKTLGIVQNDVRVSGMIATTLHTSKSIQYIFVNKKLVANDELYTTVQTNLKQMERREGSARCPVFIISLRMRFRDSFWLEYTCPTPTVHFKDKRAVILNLEQALQGKQRFSHRRCYHPQIKIIFP